MRNTRKEEKAAPAQRGGLTHKQTMLFNGRQIDLAVVRKWLIRQAILKEQQR